MNNFKFTVNGEDKTKKMFKSVTGNLKGLTSTMAKVGGTIAGLAGVAGVGGFAALTIQAVKSGAEIKRLADSVNISATSLSEWGFASERVGISGEKMGDIFKDVNDKLGDFAITGGGAAIDAINEMGLNINDLIKLSPDKQLLAIAGGFDKLGSEAEKIFILEALAGDASRLLPLLENDAEGFKKLQQEAKDLGISIDEVSAQKLLQADAAFKKIGGRIEGLQRDLAVDAAPFITVIVDELLNATKGFGGFQGAFETAFTVGGKVVGVFADGIHGLEVIWGGVKVATQGFIAAMATGFDFLINDVLIGFGNTINSALLSPLKLVIEGMEAIGAVSEGTSAKFDDFFTIDRVDGLTDFAAAMRDDLGVELQNLQALALEGLPSEAINNKIEEIIVKAKVASEKAAEDVAAGLAKKDKKGDEVVTTGGLSALEAEGLQLRLDGIQEFAVLETIQLEQKLLNEQILINKANADGLFLEGEHEAELTKLKARGTKARNQLERKQTAGQIAMALGAGAKILGAVAASSKKMFKVQKAFNIAKTAVNLPSAVIESFNNAGGYPWGIPPAAAMAAQGLKSMSDIKKTTFGGGGSTSSVSGGGGAPTIPSLPGGGGAVGLGDTGGQFDQSNSTNTPTTQITFNVTGDIVGDNGETILEKMRTLISENDAVLIEPGSRQAAELIGG